ncbi:unnamed protein product [Rotaria sp. Silwood1]|nr:unnamed protein product [Rotaria sp. Silwood1]CAF1686773.1 unnamed protein product [Rotaria sp. Silwood1]
MDDESDDSIITMSMIEKEQETMSLTITTETATTPVSRKEKKKKGIFKKDWLNIKEYSPWLQEIKNDPTKARCKACLRTFSVHYDGKTALKKHMNSDLHKSCIKSFTNTSSIVLPAPSVSEIQKISAIEGTFVYHGVAAELQIRKNANISCKDFYKFILSQEDLLKKIASNEKFDKKKRILDK